MRPTLTARRQRFKPHRSRALPSGAFFFLTFKTSLRIAPKMLKCTRSRTAPSLPRRRSSAPSPRSRCWETSSSSGSSASSTSSMNPSSISVLK
ncbi:hypothetical protein CRUP_024083, partial [Coryphaenoides rupestris]